jgi:hypothetical protein
MQIDETALFICQENVLEVYDLNNLFMISKDPIVERSSEQEISLHFEDTIINFSDID